MNNKRLEIYLADHLALMIAEVELVRRCSGSNKKTPLGDFLQQLENQVQAQKSIVQDVRFRMGSSESIESRLKQAAGWFAEKLGRLKLNDSLISYSDLSRLVELEALSAAALERISLWDNLDVTASQDLRFDGISFSFFRDQSEQHLQELHSRRRFAAATAFSP